MLVAEYMHGGHEISMHMQVKVVGQRSRLLVFLCILICTEWNTTWSGGPKRLIYTRSTFAHPDYGYQQMC